ncbi:hypothetical protein FA15DRAFT_661460 [Coprinopsis marcescibilis]|uniref:Uncharacterized protein n=1 Tax=Coprinopsis marcescibilis TaxID=230819 RepID=A0A5C3KBN2_COPMA|nr:hypothetical protein FA15DRAFT_661460 [Coprinopsis marcescibilis]
MPGAPSSKPSLATKAAAPCLSLPVQRMDSSRKKVLKFKGPLKRSDGGLEFVPVKVSASDTSSELDVGGCGKFRESKQGLRAKDFRTKILQLASKPSRGATSSDLSLKSQPNSKGIVGGSGTHGHKTQKILYWCLMTGEDSSSPPAPVAN